MPDLPAGDPDLFEPAGPHSAKLRCRVCGATGYETRDADGVIRGKSWQRRHLAGHAPCRRGCGRLLTLLDSGAPRAHGTCPSS